MGTPLRIIHPPLHMAPLAQLMRHAGKRATDEQRDVWVLHDPVLFVADGHPHKIGRGALTDLASTPWFLSWLVKPSAVPWIAAAIIHDHAYASLAPDRRTADLWWFQALRAQGCGVVRAYVTYLGLRVGGVKAWRHNRRQWRAMGNRWRYLE